MTFIIIIITIIICLVLFNRTQKDETQSFYEHDESAKYIRKAFARRFKIAGISYRCTKKDIGIIMGKVGYDSSNEYDPNAIAIIANPEGPNEKLLGFISQAEQATFRNFAYKQQELPFVGYIEEFDNEKGKAIFGKIKVYSGTDEAIEADMTEDIKSLTNAFAIKNYYTRIAELDKW
jgi:hypothetical protein